MCRSLPISSVLVNSVSPYSLSVEHALRYICNQMTSYQFFLHHKICLSIRWIMKSLWYFQIKIGGFIIQLFALLSPRAYIIHINKVFFFISCRMDNVIFLWRPIVKTKKHVVYWIKNTNQNIIFKANLTEHGITSSRVNYDCEVSKELLCFLKPRLWILMITSGSCQGLS